MVNVVAMCEHVKFTVPKTLEIMTWVITQDSSAQCIEQHEDLTYFKFTTAKLQNYFHY
jgi:hypothetical protein